MPNHHSQPSNAIDQTSGKKRRIRQHLTTGIGVLAATGMAFAMPTGVAHADPVAHPNFQKHPPARGTVPATQLNSSDCPVPSQADDQVLIVLEQHLNQQQVSPKVRLSTYEAAWVESHANNLDCGDRDSIGVFQQRPSQGWCSQGDCHDPNYAVDKYLDGNPGGGLGAIGNGDLDANYTAGQVAQQTQRSGDPDAYDQAQATAQQLEAHAAQINPQPPPAATYQWPTINPGAEGTRVRVAQLLLNAQGASLDTDGQYGPLTEDAVKTFQTANGLTADGVLGPDTWAKLTKPAQQGTTGPVADAVAWELTAQGYPVQVNGQYGTDTANQVAALRAYYRLPAGNTVDVSTWQALLH